MNDCREQALRHLKANVLRLDECSTFVQRLFSSRDARFSHQYEVKEAMRTLRLDIDYLLRQLDLLGSRLQALRFEVIRLALIYAKLKL